MQNLTQATAVEPVADPLPDEPPEGTYVVLPDELDLDTDAGQAEADRRLMAVLA